MNENAARSGGGEMLLIVGTIRLPAGRLDAARASMAFMVEASRAEVGCLEYSYAEDVLDPGLIHVKERWKGRAVLDEHFKSAHLATWRDNWRPLSASGSETYVYMRLASPSQSDPLAGSRSPQKSNVTQYPAVGSVD